MMLYDFSNLFKLWGKDMKKKILFLIHDLGVGGAEKVLVNLVNHMNRELFDITLISLFGGGVNERFIAPHIHYRAIWNKSLPGNSKIMKLLTPKQLHNKIIKEHYEIEISYLEGPCARIISGCTDSNTKLVSWIHIEQHTPKVAAYAFRCFEESKRCYERFDRTVCVSEMVRQDFLSIYPTVKNIIVRYNTIETEKILVLKDEPVDHVGFQKDEIKLVAVGKISKQKGFDRLARIINRLRMDGFPVHLYALGVGRDQKGIEEYLKTNRLENYFTFLGYQTNPYKYVARCDLFVCASLAEGFSTATMEALVLGTPVCTVEVSGMKELLGQNNEWGVITKNDDQDLYEKIKELLRPEMLLHYKEQAKIRGKKFSTDETVKAVEDTLLSL